MSFDRTQAWLKQCLMFLQDRFQGAVLQVVDFSLIQPQVFQPVLPKQAWSLPLHDYQG